MSNLPKNQLVLRSDCCFLSAAPQSLEKGILCSCEGYGSDRSTRRECKINKTDVVCGAQFPAHFMGKLQNLQISLANSACKLLVARYLDCRMFHQSQARVSPHSFFLCQTLLCNSWICPSIILELSPASDWPSL